MFAGYESDDYYEYYTTDNDSYFLYSDTSSDSSPPLPEVIINQQHPAILEVPLSEINDTKRQLKYQLNDYYILVPMNLSGIIRKDNRTRYRPDKTLLIIRKDRINMERSTVLETMGENQ